MINLRILRFEFEHIIVISETSPSNLANYKISGNNENA